MFAEEIRRAVAACHRGRLPELSAAVWKGFAAGAIAEDEAQGLAEAIEAKKVDAPIEASRRSVGSRPRSSASLERRRSWAGSGWLPPAMAARFTGGECAALAVVLAEIAALGRCELSHGAIGGRAGVSVSTVKRAVTQARTLGLVSVEERRVSWCRNLPNVITVISAELATWVRTRARGMLARKGGVQLGTTPKHLDSSSSTRPIATDWKTGLALAEVARSRPTTRLRKFEFGFGRGAGAGAGSAGLIAIDKLGNRVLFLDPDSYETVLTLDGFAPRVYEVLVAPDHATAYVPIYGDGIHGKNPHPGHLVALFDLRARRHMGDFSTYPHLAPHGLRWGPAGQLYCLCENSGIVLEMDAGTGRIEHVIPVGSNKAHRMEVLPDSSKLYTENEEDGSASVTDLRTRKLTGRSAHTAA